MSPDATPDGYLIGRGCRLCGHDSLAETYAVAGCIVETCRSCGYVQVRGIPASEYLSMYGPAYFDHAKYQNDWAARRELQRRLQCLTRARVRRGARVLDAGCATGDFVLAARDRYEMWGIDVSREAVERAQERAPELRDRLTAGRLEEAPLPPDFFDAVLLWDVVEHLWDPVAVLSRLRQALVKGGVLLLSTPNIGAWSARLLGRRWPMMTPPEHLGFLSRATAAGLLTRCGFVPGRWRSVGKWTTLGFCLYKAARLRAPRTAGTTVTRGPRRWLGWVPVYVPTGDIQYLEGRRPEE